ncbi:pyridoxamine 5'-phosphate oxidase family protein [Paenibacillus caui]|uniref:pyridoxamine 5'-phosphate oxidase family protein n=1 Tax=Paenibacillus caui TaxID=2873927 RepID=UPI001CA97A6B|nr:pyridoxamine 5'-phosphate oxidase family protein [Paenibacillus caui]
MRRTEFEIEQPEEMEAFLAEMSFGFLGTVGEDGLSRVTPLNFVYGNGVFYFHGSQAGEKMKHMKSDNRVSFTVAREFAVIPSYFTDPKLACPATSFFKSVMVQGTAHIVEDLDEKAQALSLFMNKLQPEGGYDPIDPKDPGYGGQLKAVAVYKVVPSAMSAKFKFGQNLKEPRRTHVMEGLRERDGDGDAETLQMMLKYCPFHTEK